MIFTGSGKRSTPHPDHAWSSKPPAPRTFLGALLDGTEVMVTVHDSEGVADLAFGLGLDRWTAPVELSEEAA